MTELRNLNLGFNQLTGLIPASLGNLAKLQTLELVTNQLSGEIPTTLGNLTKLRSLYLLNNQLSGGIPVSLGNLTDLQELNLLSNQLSGSIPGALGNLTNLRKLLLLNNKLSSTIPGSLGKLINLQELYLFGNELSGEIPAELGKLTNLQQLYLNNNKLSGNIPASLGNLIDLKELSLYENKLSGNIPASLGNLTNLQTLLLSTNQLSGEIPASFGNLTNLLDLSLYSNELIGGIPNSLGNLTNLQYLSLSSNKLSGEIPASLGNLTNLQYFFLEYNNLSGSIPSSLGNLTKLEYFSVYKNRMSGFIPSTLGNLIKLQNLYLHDNQFVGAIPASLGNLTKLQTLFLNNNKLSGCFPSSLLTLCGKNVSFGNNPGLPGGGNFAAFCNNEPGSNTMPAPTLALSTGVSQPVFQNASSVSLTVSGCEGGTVNWAGPNNAKGTGATIPVSTAAVGTLVYSATCTVGNCVSPSGTASVVISPATGNFDGFVYGVDCETFRGWAWDRDKGNTVISVDILDGATVIATIPAGNFRQDLLNAGKGNGKHAFTFPIPANLKDGQPHQFTARVAGSNFQLKNPPKPLTCQGTGGPVNQPPIAPTTIPGNITTSTNYFYSLNLPAFIDPENGTLNHELTGLPSGLSFTAATRLISGISTTSGIFILTYSATDNQGAKSQVTIEFVLIPAPVVNQPPIAPVTNPLSTTIGMPFSVTLPVFTDPESQSLTYSLFGLPDGLGFTGSNRTIIGTAAVGMAGWYVLTYSASDGTNTTPVNFTLAVNPGNTTPPPVVTGEFEGYLSVVNCQEMRGWVWDRNKPNMPLMVEFFSDGISIGTIEAKNYRQDLKDAQKGNGNHGYVFPTPASIKDNGNHQISAKVQNSRYTLKGSPMLFKCAPSGRLSAESTPNQLDVVILGNPTNRDAVEVEVRGVEGQSVRLQVTNTSGQVITEHLVEQAAAVERQILSLKNQSSGVFMLKATSGSRSVTLKVLKE
ncbi:hypothetical protein GCM10028804_01670 [Larkinella terrae]